MLDKKVEDLAATMQDYGRTWDVDNPENSKVTYHGQRKSNLQETPCAGFFWYAGLGSGDLYMPDGRILSCAPSEASEMCHLLGIERKYVDSFSYFHVVAVGDR
jgi:hypothetical protein